MSDQVLVLGGRTFSITDHCVSRLLDMCIEAREVVQTLENPVCVYDCRQGVNLRGLRITLGCVVNNGIFYVKTALWSRDEDWSEDLKRGAYGGRTAA